MAAVASSPHNIMISPLDVSELLTNNVYLDLYSTIFIMTKEGSLIAYSYPADIVSTKDQAAVVAMAWVEHSHPSLKAITIQDESYNTIARAMKDGNLLVLIGRAGDVSGNMTFKITTETAASPAFHGATSDGELANPLKFQRQKADAILKALESA